MNRISKRHSILSLVLLIALIAAMALSVVSCGNDTADDANITADTAVSETSADSISEPSSTEVGDGQTTFTLNVKLGDGTIRSYTVNTDKTVVGDALDEVGLIEYDEGAYGKFITHVCGEKHVYDDDGSYWAFYINGEYANSGVDSTEIKADEIYSLEAAK